MDQVTTQIEYAIAELQIIPDEDWEKMTLTDEESWVVRKILRDGAVPHNQATLKILYNIIDKDRDATAEEEAYTEAGYILCECGGDHDGGTDTCILEGND